MTTKGHSTMGSTPEHYKRLGIRKNDIKPWEDGYRTKDVKGTYEWWYFDSQMDDGSTLVIVFYSNKWTLAPKKGPTPQVTFALHTADGQEFSETMEMPFSSFEAAVDHCRVKIEDCLFEGDLHEYHIRFNNGKIEANVRLAGNVPSWRPETGYFYFGDQEQHYFAWLPSVPEGRVEAEVKVEGKTLTYTGTGYHDHNWGNISMMSIIRHWYWGRAKIGRYQTISSYISGEKKFGDNKFPIFMLAKDGEIIADDAVSFLHFWEEDPYTDSQTGQTFYNRLLYDYNDGRQHYRVTYQRERDIEFHQASASLSKPLQLLAKVIRLDGVYIRFTGMATIECFDGSHVVESVSGPAIWELTSKI
ncbi:lipocalin-like domain-containing protein [Paenibacillus physcomitrellae]|uniref:Diels-Alderase N-terminal domain-containing protein n=2 Tax=Paenibacillus physcomitrellae TaxID=1619311 RepID=A0ABQ1GFR4_9BACL|nr:lipocalin-like domain-containing protein [Paenibacillus physcomitrellae]GGA42611.1 hypothetical protein GCM10010917_29910 [Paenibacillus physcomitrellae]